MSIKLNKITPCLWFDHQAEPAARFYASIFKKSRVGNISRYGKAGHEVHGQPEGKVLTVEFQIAGQTFTALNGGPVFKFNEAISFQVICKTQKEIDHYWNKLSKGGDKSSQQCGWLKDKFGVSWQIIPQDIGRLIGNPKSKGSQRAMNAMLKMKKINLAELRRAYAGNGRNS